VRSKIGAQTLRAYRQTDYTVHARQPFVLRVGAPQPALAALYRERGVACAAFLTASNPRSRLLQPAVNERRQARLRRALERQGRSVLPGTGRHPLGGWPGEPSFLVPGLSRAAARALGRRFGQNAVLWCGPDTVARLLLLR